ncbi:MAG: cystathionine beta-synthase [Anaerolineales bacterium]|jgi:cystathionine beta-synthase
MKEEKTILSEDLRVYGDVRGAIGDTPLVRLNKVASDLGCTLYAKLEMLNPGGSIKDRIAFNIIENYEKEGRLKPGGTVVEATSGNTGVGLAIACAIKGYQSVFVMPDKMSQEKIDTLRAYGARVVVTPTAVEPDDPRSYYSVADRIVAETSGAVLANQYHNPSNPESHYLATGPEIWRQTQGRVTDIVIGMGTGGTITGIGRYMRDQGHAVKIVGVDPKGSLLYDAWKQGGSAEGLEATTYKVEGIGEDFIPSTLDLSLADQVVQVDDKESFLWTRRMVREEGIFCGGSSGAALAGAIKYARDLGPDRVVVVILPDSGSRYLSKIFDDRWMEENGFLDREPRQIPVSDLTGLQEIVTAAEIDPVADVVERMRTHAISQLPVVDPQGHLTGLVTEIDLLKLLLEAGESDRVVATIEPVVRRDVKRVSHADTLGDVMPDLLQEKVVILVDNDQQPTGILTIIDALAFLSSKEA